jgi:hypothetical protein
MISMGERERCYSFVLSRTPQETRFASSNTTRCKSHTWHSQFKKSIYAFGSDKLDNRRSSMAPRSERFGVRSWKLSNVGQSLDE